MNLRDAREAGVAREPSSRSPHARLEEELRQARDFAQTLIRTANVMIVGLDLSGRVTLFNEAAERLTGYRRKELVGRRWFDVVVPRDRYPEVWEPFHEWMEGGVLPETLENPILTKGGEERFISWRNSEIRQGGRVTGSVSFGIDLTERRRAEESVARAEARFRTLVEQIPAIVYTAQFGETGDWLYVSPQIETILGIPPDEWLSHPNPWTTQLHPKDRERVFAEEAAAFRRGTPQPFALEYRMVTRDGRVVWFRDEAVPVYDDGSGRPVMLGVMYDITEHKRAEQTLRQSERQYQEAYQREREAVARLQALDEMKDTFLQAVSHELRTPLAVVVGSSLTLQRGGELTSDEARDLLAGLSSAARKLQWLLADLLDLDRLGRGILEPNRRMTDVGALVRGVAEQPDLLPGHPVTVDAPRVMAHVDGPKVERIVENLLANTAKHTPAGTPVWVRVSGGADGVLIEVEDAGPGVPAELRNAIFEPFRQGPTSGGSTPTPGVGIGLSLVARFTELHGGRVWVEPRPEGGTLFRVLLPG